MRNRIKGVIFDLDGTLIDSKKDILGAFHYAFNKLNKEKPEDEKLIHTIGSKLEECFLPFLGNDEVLLKNAANLFREYYEEKYLEKTRPFDNIDEMLKSCAKEYKLAITTMKKGNYARKIIEAFNWKNYFESVVGAEEGLKAKPNPDMLLKAVCDLNLKISDVVYIGDTEIDYLMAQNSQVEFIFVSWGYGKLNGKYKNIEICNSPLEIIDILK